jgi:hypothetical protein
MNINLLPSVLQDLISEFNVEHRPKMLLVFNELFQYFTCMNCSSNFYDIIYTKTILSNKFICCSKWCMDEIEHHIRKSYRQNYFHIYK